jgi:LL-diaminopimelate aminotransferase
LKTALCALPVQTVDLIYLCSRTIPPRDRQREQLAAWVRYARREQGADLFDAAYEAFIRDSALPTASTRSKARATWRSSSAAFQRRPVSPARAAPIRCAKSVMAYTKKGEAVRCIRVKRRTLTS